MARAPRALLPLCAALACVGPPVAPDGGTVVDAAPAVVDTGADAGPSGKLAIGL